MLNASRPRSVTTGKPDPSITSEPNFKKLENGLGVWIVPMAGRTTVTANLAIQGGSSIEACDEYGASHALEHMLFGGTKVRPDTIALCRAVEKYGALFNGNTDKEYIAYSATLPAVNVGVAIDVLADIFRNSTLPPEVFHKERQVIQEERRDLEDDLLYKGVCTMDTLLFGDTALSRPIIGNRRSIDQLSLPVLERFYSKWYSPSNAILVVAGGVDHTVFEIAEQHFGSARSWSVPAMENQIDPPPQRFAQMRIPRQRAVVKLAFPLGGYRDVNEPVLRLAHNIFGGTGYSKLEDAVRLKDGLCYSNECEYELYSAGGFLCITVETGHRRVNQVLGVVTRSIEDFTRNPLTEDDLKIAKQCLIGQEIVASDETSNVAGSVMMELLETGRLLSSEQNLRAIEAVSLDEMNDAIPKLFDLDKLKVALVGNLPERIQLPF